MGADFRWWRTLDITDIDSPAQQGPAGVEIPAMHSRVDERIASYSAGVGVLGRAPAGRLAVIAGTPMVDRLTVPELCDALIRLS